MKQCPQEMLNGITTRSPTLRLSTSPPTSSTTPMASWPRMSPGLMNAPSTSYRCRSNPQMFVLVTRMIASLGSLIAGSGTVSTDTFRRACHLTARMGGLLEIRGLYWRAHLRDRQTSRQDGCMAAGGTVVELRVHGVSGTPPEALLSCPVEFLELQAGDKSAGFYRRQPWIDAASGGGWSTWRRVTEAYSWGGLTSGPASRALWLLFLPFIFINLAHWMLPPVARQRRAAAIAVALLRLIALSLTLILMLAAAVAVMDVTVWQCVALDYCAAQWGPLAFLASMPRGTQVSLSAVPLVVVIVVLWRLGGENAREIGRPPDPAVMADEVPLESDTFWCIDPSVVRLRACHVMAWTAGLAALTLAAPLSYRASTAGLILLTANGA